MNTFRMSSRPIGDIVTLLDLTPRDMQDGELFPLQSQTTYWLPNEERRIRPFTLGVQSYPLRGPAAFGQRFTFDLGSVNAGDLLLSTVLQINLGHWFDATSQLRFASGRYTFTPNQNPFYYANSLGSVILQQAELEVDGTTIEIVDGDFLNVASLLFQDVNSQFGFSADGLGRTPFSQLGNVQQGKLFPTQNGTIYVPLPLFFQRVKLQEAFPLLACRDGTVRIHITLRPFSECVRRLNGVRSSCDEVPTGQRTFPVTDTNPEPITSLTTIKEPEPTFQNVQLITYSAHTDGTIRQKILREPFEVLHRTCNTFLFDEPLKYQVSKNTASDTISVQLPLDINHPMEEILWFVRRKDAANNNAWTNYSAVLQHEWHPIYNPQAPLLHSALIQLNGIDLIQAEEQWFRQHIALRHYGGVAAYNAFVYGYSFADMPAEHQPSGTANASRLQSVRLTLNVRGDVGLWEVKVFVVTLEWLRFQDGICNKMFSD